MLKGFVSGEEKDIVRIPMNGKNLWDNLSTISKERSPLYYEAILGAPLPEGVYTFSAKVIAEEGITACRVSFRKGTTGQIVASNIDVSSERTSITVTLTEPCYAVYLYGSNSAVTSAAVTYQDIMLNLGDTAIPYEPYGYQEGWEVRDNQDRLIWGREDELQTATGTLHFKGYSLPLKVKSILGNTVQNGTPAPDNIITPEMCGVRTVNICPSAAVETKTNNGITAVSNGSGTYHVSGTATADADIRFNVQSFWIPQSIGNYHDGTFSMFNSAIYDNTAVKLAFYYQGTKLDDWGLTSLNRTNTTYSNMSEKDCDAIGFTVKSGVTVDFTISPEFTNDGILPTEFEPYGYKIPFTCAGQTTPIYLGEVPTIRRIKKLVFDGTEEWVLAGTTGHIYRLVLDGYYRTSDNTPYCTHYDGKAPISTIANLPDKSCALLLSESGNNYFYINETSITATSGTAEEWKSYLAAQYAAGNPVTVWYVLATPTTGIVNEPLCKIGDYADELNDTVATLPEIPTTTGENTLTVDTTLAPYEVTVEGHIRHGYWGKIREDVRSGAAQTKFPVGTIFYDNEDETTGTAFQVVGYDKHFDPEMTARGYTHSMTLCELKLTDLVTFDATEALLYVETAIAPGTYRFKIPNYDATYGGNKSYYFTTTKSIPVGGQITINWPYQQTPKTASTYSEIAGVTAIESGLTLSEWIEGDSPAAIDLGTAAGPNAELGTSSFGKMNHIHRARYGSNNYLQSGIRQYINSDKAASSWWSPQTVFDRPYGSRTSAGKLSKLSSEFVDALVKPEIKSRANSYFETDSLDGTKFSVSTDYTITTDKMFLLSPNEVGLNADTTTGSTLDYYLNATNADRIKHRASNDAAYYWWLRTPLPTYASIVRYVSTSGALNNNNASNTSGVAAACVIQ